MKKKVLLDEISKDIWHCSRCMMCEAVCTVHKETRKEAHAPYQKVWLLDVIRRGIIDFDEKSVEIMYEGCVLCKLCQEYCVARQDIANTMATAKAEIVNLGKAPKRVLEVDHNLESTKNPTGEAIEERFTKINLPKKSAKTSDIVLFIGCTVSYYRPEIANAMMKILDASGINYTVMKDEVCCGSPAYDLGLRQRAIELAKDNAKAIKTTGAKKVVTLCPGCARTLKLEYKKWGVDLGVDIIHHTELIDQLLKEGKLKLSKPLNSILTYHDPCHLGRYLEVYEAPRSILKKTTQAKLVEMWRNKERALCCGAGGGNRLTYPKTAEKIAYGVVGEAIRTGAEILSTACPTCKLSFLGSMENKKGIEVKDVAEIVAEAI